MKMHKIITGLALCGAVLATFTGCKGEYDADYKRVYLDQATTSYINKVIVDPNEASKPALTVRLVEPQNAPVKVTLGLDEAMIQEYNTKYGASFELLPSTVYSYTQELTIEAGKTVASSIVIIEPFENTGAAYALPLRITKVEGPVEASVASSRILFLLDQPIIQSVPQMGWNTHPRSQSIIDTTGQSDWKEPVNAWSLECWVWMSGYPINNQAIFNFKADTEIYIRFGDAPIPYNSLQIKTKNTQNNSNFLFTKEQWNHIAFVYSGDSGELKLYVDGTLDFTLPTSGGPVTISGIEMISSGSTYFPSQCRMAQVRLWKKALSQGEINSNKLSVVKSDNSDLLGYWKLDEGDGLTMKDCTSHGRDLIATDPISWIPNTRFDGK